MLRKLRALAIGLVVLSLAVGPAPEAAPGQQTTAPSPSVTFRIIVVSSADGARSVVERIGRGASFESLASEESIDPSARQGGVVGPVMLSELRPELRDVLQMLAPGETGPIVRVRLGFAIVQRVREVTGRARISSTEIRGLAAVGSVQPTVSVDGFAEANTIMGEFPKSEDWNQDPREIYRVRRESFPEVVATLAKFAAVAPDSKSVPPIDVVQAYVVLGQLHAHAGRMTEAIEQFELAYPRTRADLPDAIPQIEEMLGVAHLHKSGMTNGVFQTPGDRCLLSSTPTPYADRRDSEKAIDYFMKVLERRPQDQEARWLLNLAYMTVGGYPGRVPPAHLISPSTFESSERVGRFVDVAAESGVDSFSSAGGVIVDDFDNDGDPDSYVSNLGGGNLFYRNNGDRTFSERAAAAGVPGADRGFPTWFFDYDNDGWEDLLVSSYYLSVDEISRSYQGLPTNANTMRVYKNLGSGTFRDMTTEAKLDKVYMPMGSNFGDIDNDGFLDIYFGSGGSFGASPLQQHVGLGKAPRRVDVEIWWPTSNTRQRFANVTKNQVIQIQEMSNRYTALDRAPAPLGGRHGR